jgi:zinc transport system substrate-binding protein
MTEGIHLLSICKEDELVAEHAHCHHHHDEGKDLHVWLSPTLVKGQVQKITEALITLLPNQQTRFRTNLQIFLNELDELDRQIAHLLEPTKGKAILVSHPAFGYFCRDYQLTQLSIEIEGKDPLPRNVAEILTKANCYAIKTVLTEPQYSNKGAELLAQSLGLQTRMVDPYAENYSDNLLFIAKAISE